LETIIARVISPTPSLFIAQRLPTIHPFPGEYGEISNLGETIEVGWEKWRACMSTELVTKATISLKRVGIKISYYMEGL